MNFQTDEIDIDYIINSGLLFEINRSVLHLFGIALTVKVEQGEKSWSFKDMRESPEEAVLPPEVYQEGKKKLEKFLHSFGKSQINRRAYCFGASCQNHPDFHQKRGFHGKRV